MQNLLKEISVLKSRVETLEGFAASILCEFWDSQLDGADLQEIGSEYGLLIEEMRYQPCGEDCDCEQYCSEADFIAGVSCFEYSPELMRAIRKQTLKT